MLDQYCWTPLLVATKENCVEIVQKLLEKKPNVNAADNNGCTALTIASKEGYYDICTALINAGAYVNLQVTTIVFFNIPQTPETYFLKRFTVGRWNVWLPNQT